MTPIDDQIKWMRLQRDIAITVAILSFAGSVAAALPGLLRRQNQVQIADAKILELQADISWRQEQTRIVQARIVQTQDEIRVLLHRSH